MATEIQGLPEADRKVEDGIGMGLAGDSDLGESHQTLVRIRSTSQGSYLNAELSE